MFIIPLLLTALSLVSADASGLYLGMNVAYLMIIRKGTPKDAGSMSKRAARVFIALLIFGASSFALDFWFRTVGMINYLHFTLIGFSKAFIPAFTIWVSVAFCTWLDLYKREKGSLQATQRVIK
jgi:hypothetical protein